MAASPSLFPENLPGEDARGWPALDLRAQSSPVLPQVSNSHRVVSCSRLLLLLSRFRRVRLCATPQTAAHQAPPSLGFSRREHWSGVPFPSPVCGSLVASQLGISAIFFCHIVS